MTFRSSKYLCKGGIYTASKEKITELMRMFITYKIATELPGKFIKEITNEDYQKFFQSSIIVKENAEITFEQFKLTFEKKVIELEKETTEKIIGVAIDRMPFLAKLSDAEIDQVIATLKTPQGYAMREIIEFFLENIGEIMDNRAWEISLSCFDIMIEIVDLNKKIDMQKSCIPDMN
jgi:hypothetical protein